MFYNTTNETGQKLADYWKKAGEEGEEILQLFKQHIEMTADEVVQLRSEKLINWMIDKIKKWTEVYVSIREMWRTVKSFAIKIRSIDKSTRRAITDLYNEGLIEKTESKKRASSGRMNYVYKVV